MRRRLSELSASGLWVDLYELTMAQVYFKYKRNTQASFELFIRSPRRPFYLILGIREALKYLENLKFSPSSIDYLRGLKLFDGDFLSYLRKFRFRGDVWAVEEPKIMFAEEPIMRISASLIEAQIVESALLNILNLYTTLATKALRVVISAWGRKVYDFSLRRTQGLEASLASAKASYIAGCEGSSNVLAGFLYRIPVVGTMAHSYVMSFSQELESFRYFSRVYPSRTVLLIDTYDLKEGLKNAITVAKELQKNKYRLIGLRIDSGDLLESAKYVRRVLDAQGLIDTIILVSGNLDEYKIKELVGRRVPIDAFGVGTNMGTSSDLPYTDVIYKIIEITSPGGGFLPVMKLSPQKATLPFKKQVFRKFSRRGVMLSDTLALEKEKLSGLVLLKKVMDKGRIIVEEKDIQSMRREVKQELKRMPSELKDIETKFIFPVQVSKKLNKEKEKVSLSLTKRVYRKSVLFFDVDTQVDFVLPKGNLYVEGADALIRTWQELTDFALRKDIKIISSQDTHSRKDIEFKDFPPHCVEATPGIKKISQTLLPSHFYLDFRRRYSLEELTNIKDSYPQIILKKNKLDVFTNPNTQELINLIKPEAVYVYGVATEFCVRGACSGLARIVDRVYLVEDGIKEISPEAKEKTFLELKSRGVKFIKTQEVFRFLE